MKAPQAPPWQSGRRSLKGLALILIFVAVIFANFTFTQLNKASSFDNWTTTEATVVDCLNERKGIFYTGIGSDCQMVTCQFTTGGQIQRKYFRSPGWKYHKGQTVEMRFDPLQPQHSTVNPGATGAITLWGSAAFAVFFIAGIALLIHAFKKPEAAPKSLS